MKWSLLKSETQFSGFFKLVTYHYIIERFNGGQLALEREVFERGCAAAVLAYDPIHDAVVLVEQFRPGAMYEKNPWLIELIAGIVEEGEDAREVVVREAIEEAGCELKNVIPIAEYLVSPGGSTETVAVFVAICDSTRIAEYAGLENEGEDIRVHVVPRGELMKSLHKGHIRNGMTLIASQWLAIHFEQWKRNEFTRI